VEGNDHSTFKVLIQHLSGGTEENHKKPWSGSQSPGEDNYCDTALDSVLQFTICTFLMRCKQL
jgi:hypothetical protein